MCISITGYTTERQRGHWPRPGERGRRGGWWSGAYQGDSVCLAGASFCLTRRSSMIVLSSLPLGHTEIQTDTYTRTWKMTDTSLKVHM